jgi:hypothetical protein
MVMKTMAQTKPNPKPISSLWFDLPCSGNFYKKKKGKCPMVGVEGCRGYGGRDSSCHGYCDQCILTVIAQTMFAPKKTHI